MFSVDNNLISNVANHFGTPTYLYDFNVIAKKYGDLRSQLLPDCDVFYSMKANPLLSICQFLKRLGASCEVSSGNELEAALSVGFQPNKIIFVGPGKKKEELERAILIGLRAIICESTEELFLINAISKSNNIKTAVLIRINPNFTVTNAPIKMSGVSTQFGITIDVFLSNIKEIRQCKFIDLEGIQIYNASRILDVNAIILNIKNILDLSCRLSSECGIAWKTVDFGGGFGVPYFKSESELEITRLIDAINNLILQYKNKKTQFILELGRYLVAESGYLISSVQSIKKVHDKNYVIVDSGMHCHLGVSGMGSFVHRNFPMRHISLNMNKAKSKNKINYQVAGLLCTPGDLLLRDVCLENVFVDDLIVIEKTGAYGLTASPGRFLSHGSPAEVIYKDDKLFLSRRRETFQDIVSTQYLTKE